MASNDKTGRKDARTHIHTPATVAEQIIWMAVLYSREAQIINPRFFSVLYY